jgi:hypothetical protein
MPDSTWGLGTSFARIRELRWAGACVIALLGSWFAIWMWALRYHQLDDSFITLRYARNLRLLGRLAFNPSQQSHGTSSLLYVYLVALFYAWLPSPLLTKILSLTAYLLLAVAMLRRAMRIGSEYLFCLWSLYLVVILSPMAMRWLSDGMDTSLYVLDAYALASIVASRPLPERQTLVRNLVLFALGAITVFLRIEAIVLVGAAALASAILRADQVRGKRLSIGGLVAAFVPEWCLSGGALLACAIVIAKFGKLLPDTAFAKSNPFTAFTRGYLIYLAHSVGATFTFGLGLLTLALVSALLVLATSQSIQERAAALAANAPLPALIVAAWSRGQEAQFRYFIASLVFAITWNLSKLERAPDALKAGHQRWVANAAIAMFAIALIGFGGEAPLVRHITAERSRAFVAMRAQNLERLASGIGIAADIGMVGWFTHAEICDLSGLVEGSEWAHLSPDERARLCAQRPQAFVFVNHGQARSLGRYLDLKSMVVCFRYLLPNVSTDDAHVLYVEPRLAGEICRPPASTNAPPPRLAVGPGGEQ